MFYEKYLEYKKKYINLKNLLNIQGGYINKKSIKQELYKIYLDNISPALGTSFRSDRRRMLKNLIYKILKKNDVKNYYLLQQMIIKLKANNINIIIIKIKKDNGTYEELIKINYVLKNNINKKNLTNISPFSKVLEEKLKLLQNQEYKFLNGVFILNNKIKNNYTYPYNNKDERITEFMHKYKKDFNNFSKSNFNIKNNNF